MKPGRYTRKMMYVAGAAGTETFEVGDRIVSIHIESHAATGAFVVFGGDTVIVDGAAGAGQHETFSQVWPDDARFEATAAAKTIVFTDTAAYMVCFLRLRPVVPV